MKQKSLLRSMLLLFALIVGSSSAWADGSITFDFEDDTAHRTSGSNSYSSDGNTYTENNVSISLKFADAVTTGSPLNGSANVLGRVAKNTTNSPVVLIGPISITDKAIKSVSYKTKGVEAMAMAVEYSLDNANWNSLQALSSMPTTSTTESISNLNITGTNFYLRFTVSVSSSTSSNRDFQLDDIVISYAEAGSTFKVTYNGNENTGGTVPTDDNEYESGATVTVSGNTGNLAKTGYTFDGWNTKADGTGTTYVANDQFTITSSITLYAKWNANTHNVTLPANDVYGEYTMNNTNPVAYGTEVTLTYTPATGYENYKATWSVNDEPITGNKFTMPDENVTVTVSVEEVTTANMTIDFESAASSYTDWTFTNMTSKQTGDITAHNNSTYYGTTGGNGSASITTNSTIANPVSLTCYVSKQSGNTTSSTWYIQVKGKNETSWTDVETQSATSMSAGTWVEFTADLSNYSDVYVRVYYSGSTAIRNIDDLTLTYEIDQNVASITTDPTSLNLNAESHNGSIVVTYTNITSGQSVVLCDAEGTAASYDWITASIDGTTHNVNYAINANNTGAARTAYLKVHGVDAENTDIYSSLVTINQAKLVVNVNYNQASEFVPGRHYIIVGSNNNVYKAMGEQGEKNRAAVGITVNEGATTIASDAGVSEVLLGVDESGFFTFYDEENNGYLYASGTGTNNNMNVQSTLNDHGRWTIETDNNGALIILAQAGSRNQLQYNNSSSIFSCYNGTQINVYLFERDGDTGGQDFTASIDARCNDGKGNFYGTYSAPFAFTVPSDVTVSEISVSGGILSVTNYEEGATIPANTGVLISSTTAGDKTFTSAKGGTSVLGNSNNLRPTYWGISAPEMAEDGSNWYYRLTMHGADFQNNIPGTIGFWWGAEDGAAFDYLTGYRAYLVVPQSQAPAMGFGLDDATTGIQSIERTINDNQYYTLDGRRVAEPTKGLYILNGKKVIVK